MDKFLPVHLLNQNKKYINYMSGGIHFKKTPLLVTNGIYSCPGGRATSCVQDSNDSILCTIIRFDSSSRLEINYFYNIKYKKPLILKILYVIQRNLNFGFYPFLRSGLILIPFMVSF